jgi:tRNA threonylcarbamoyladenosine modification (KEOPS) complex  Pcc1 subunit
VADLQSELSVALVAHEAVTIERNQIQQKISRMSDIEIHGCIHQE